MDRIDKTAMSILIITAIPIVLLIYIFRDNLTYIVSFGMVPFLSMAIYMVYSVRSGRKEIKDAWWRILTILSVMVIWSAGTSFSAFSVRNIENRYYYEVPLHAAIGYSITTIIAMIIAREEISFSIQSLKKFLRRKTA